MICVRRQKLITRNVTRPSKKELGAALCVPVNEVIRDNFIVHTYPDKIAELDTGEKEEHYVITVKSSVLLK